MHQKRFRKKAYVARFRHFHWSLRGQKSQNSTWKVAFLTYRCFATSEQGLLKTIGFCVLSDFELQNTQVWTGPQGCKEIARILPFQVGFFLEQNCTFLQPLSGIFKLKGVECRWKKGQRAAVWAENTQQNAWKKAHVAFWIVDGIRPRFKNRTVKMSNRTSACSSGIHFNGF